MSDRGRPRTQAEIARLAGVSQATVSLVVSGKAGGGGRIPPATRRRVEEVLEQVGYVANPAARALVQRRNNLLGVFTFEPVFPSDRRDFYAPFLTGIEEEAERLGYDLVLFTSAAGGNRRRSLYSGGVNRLQIAAGCLLLGRNPDPTQVARLRDEGFPFVFVGRRDIPGPAIPHVTADYGESTSALTQRLLDLGHERIEYLRVSTSAVEPSIDRQRGFREALIGAGVPAPGPPEVQTCDPRKAPAVLRELLERGVTAVLVEQQLLADNLHAAASAMDVTIPDDLSVIVLGDTIGAAEPALPWTGFHAPRHDMGATAARLLVHQIDPAVEAPERTGLRCLIEQGETVAAPRRATVGRVPE